MSSPGREAELLPRTVLVTGAGGLVGSAVCRALAARAVPVVALVGPPGYQPPVPVFADRLVFGDITDSQLMASLVADCDAVVHLAGPSSVAHSFVEPAEYARSHVVGTATLLSACKGSNARTLVHVSSAEVYGGSDGSPVAEDRCPRPHSPYGVAKLAAEELVHALAAEIGLTAVALRPFSVYGPGSPPWSLVGTILRQILAGSGVRLSGPRAVRDYCYADDVAAAVLSALDQPPGELYGVFNIGCGHGVSAREVVDAAFAVTGRNLPVATETPDRPAGASAPVLVADVRRARDELGWTAQTPLAEGLARTWDWMRGHV